jgi:hypothetical protein
VNVMEEALEQMLEAAQEEKDENFKEWLNSFS